MSAPAANFGAYRYAVTTLEHCHDSSDWHVVECIKEIVLLTHTGIWLHFLSLSGAQPAELRALGFHHMSASCKSLLPNFLATAQDHIEYWVTLTVQPLLELLLVFALAFMVSRLI